MINPIHSVGARIESKCTKCKTITRHLIVALVDGAPARVQCSVCGGFHNYRAAVTPKPREAAGRAVALRVARRVKNVSAVATEWQALIEGKRSEDAVPYHMSRCFQGGDLLDHPTFGLGFVRKAIRPDTIEVHFREGIKRLRCTL